MPDDDMHGVVRMQDHGNSAGKVQRLIHYCIHWWNYPAGPTHLPDHYFVSPVRLHVPRMDMAKHRRPLYR